MAFWYYDKGYGARVRVVDAFVYSLSHLHVPLLLTRFALY